MKTWQRIIRTKSFLLSLAFWLLPIYAWATEACTGTADPVEYNKAGDRVERTITWTWTSDTDGTVNSLGALRNVTGMVLGCRLYPGAGVSSYTAKIFDSQGGDILNGNGANMSTATTGNYIPMDTIGFRMLINQTLTPDISGAGDTKTGTIILYLK